MPRDERLFLKLHHLTSLWANYSMPSHLRGFASSRKPSLSFYGWGITRINPLKPAGLRCSLIHGTWSEFKPLRRRAKCALKRSNWAEDQEKWIHLMSLYYVLKEKEWEVVRRIRGRLNAELKNSSRLRNRLTTRLLKHLALWFFVLAKPSENVKSNLRGDLLKLNRGQNKAVKMPW